MNIVSFSGGKDSTAMLLMMLERGMPVDEIIFCDTGMEFLGMYDHIEQVERYMGRAITRLTAKHSFEYYMFEYVKIKGKTKGEVGYAWACPNSRWCTGTLKKDVFNRYLKKYKGHKVYQYIGIAIDEAWRCKDLNYPLVEWKITEPQALKYCYSKGFDWGGLYRHFRRVSCWCCPLQGLNELRNLRRYFPELWQQLRDMDKRARNQFRPDFSVEQLESRFAKEDEYMKNQMSLFG